MIIFNDQHWLGYSNGNSNSSTLGKNMICVQNHEKGHSQLRTMVLVYLPKHVPENLDVVGKFTST